MNEALYFTSCALCGDKENYHVVYKENVSLHGLSDEVFSARRNPDRIHFRIVRCKHCGLLRSNPVISSGKLSILYEKSKFIYGEEVDNLKTTYKVYLNKLNTYNVQKDKLLEIGCGNGFFLETALCSGYKSVSGIEPSKDAVEKASPEVRGCIVNDNFPGEGLKENDFNVICHFQVIEHVDKPNEFLTECFKILKPSGFVLGVSHNINSLLAKLLREKCPVIDIGHMYLYNKKTMMSLYKKNGFSVLETGDVKNTYSLKYWISMLPIRESVKRLLSNQAGEFLRRVAFSMKAGNQYIIAKKS